MNYRHIYHAGNFCDVMKHALIARILTYLGLKPAPLRFIDTHAGIGLYNLAADEAERTGEWRDGVARLDRPFSDDVEALLAPYRSGLNDIRAQYGASFYPGSPLVAAQLMRNDDRAIFIEKHPTDSTRLLKRLKECMGRDNRFKVLEMDGWTALNAMIPPPERRGLVLIDPPFEELGEHKRLGQALKSAALKWETGIFAGWYPIKNPRDADDLAAAVAGAGTRGVLRLELIVDALAGPDRLSGCGLMVVNPPWMLADEARVILPALAERLAQGRRTSWRADMLA
jgi:23S rRNA (adenine2030-N6)-methyltransferase